MRRFSYRRSDVVVALLLAASLSSSVILAVRVQKLSRALEPADARHVLAPGDMVSPLSAKTVDGTPTTITFSDVSVPTILYVFTPQCVWCKRNTENLKTIARTSQGRFRIIGISLTPLQLREYVASEQFEFPIVYDIAPTASRDYGMGVTPQTIVVSVGGYVLKNWRGAYADVLQGEVERFFGIRLPGLTSDDDQVTR